MNVLALLHRFIDSTWSDHRAEIERLVSRWGYSLLRVPDTFRRHDDLDTWRINALVNSEERIVAYRVG